MSSVLLRYPDRHLLPDNDAVCIFNHMPKTGGTSIRNAINDYYGFMNEIAYFHTDFYLDTAQFVGGHGSFGAHRLLPKGKKCFYITFLRHPLHLLISYYKFICAHGRAPVTSQGIAKMLVSQENSNVLTRHLGGGDLDRAREVLFCDHVFFGLQECYFRSFFHLSFLLPFLGDSALPRANVSRPAELEIDDAVLAVFEEVNAFDLALYHEACAVFDERYPAVSTQQCPPLGDISFTSMSFANELYPLQLNQAERADLLSTSLSAPGKNYFSVFSFRGMQEEEWLCRLFGDVLPGFLRARAEFNLLKNYKQCMRTCATHFLALDAYDKDDAVAGYCTLKAFFLSLYLASYLRTFGESPFPQRFSEQLPRFKKHKEIVCLLEVICELNSNVLLEWYLLQCPIDEISDPYGRAHAYIVIGAMALRNSDFTQAIDLARKALCLDRWSSAGAVLFSQAERRLFSRTENSLATLERFIPVIDKIVGGSDLAIEYLLALEHNGLSVEYRERFLTLCREKDFENYLNNLRGELREKNLQVPTPLEPEALSDLGGQLPLLLLMDVPLLFADLIAPFLQAKFVILYCSRQWAEECQSVCERYGWQSGGVFDPEIVKTPPDGCGSGLGEYADALFVTSALPAFIPETPVHLGGYSSWRPPLLFPVQRLLLATPSGLRNERLEFLFRNLRKAKTVAVWGRGEFYSLYIRQFFEHSQYAKKLQYFIESEPVPPFQHDDLPVLSPEEAATRPADLVLVATAHRNLIAQDAAKAGIGKLFIYDPQLRRWPCGGDGISD